MSSENTDISNISYINKDFPVLWNEILSTVPKLTNKWDPKEANESDPLAVLLKVVALFADKVNYSADKGVLELFPATLTQLRAAYNVYETLGYTPDYYVSARTYVDFIYGGGFITSGDSDSDTPQTSEGVSGDNVPFTVPRFTTISDETGQIIYTTLGEASFTTGKYETFKVPVIEGTWKDFSVNNNKRITLENLDADNRLYFVENNIAQNGIFITDAIEGNESEGNFSYIDIDDNAAYNDTSNTWRRVDNLALSINNSKVYKLGIDATDGSVYIQFPEDIGRLIGNGIFIRYILSSGESGNIKAGTLSQFADSSDFITGNVTVSPKNITVQNNLSTSNGANPLDIEEMRAQFNRVKGVFDTLVTIRDYENYIYEFDNRGIPIVSNIRVSDRTNDLYDSFKVRNFALDSSSRLITEVAEVEEASIVKPSMTAFDLRFYPLPVVTAIDSYDTYSDTFSLDNQNTTIIIDNIVTAIDASKSISHDLYINDSEGITNYTVAHDGENMGSIINIPYSISGQIYLKNAVSAVEAANIKSNVDLAIYKAFYSRELEFGKPIDYIKLLDVVQSADNRILYAAIMPPAYNAPTIYDALKDSQKKPWRIDESTIILRNIMRGNLPWVIKDGKDAYNVFSYNYGEKSSNVYPPAYDAKNAVYTLLNRIEPLSTIPGNESTYTVNDNEQFYVIGPQYNDIMSYGNYLYALFLDENNSNPPTKIIKNMPYTLGKGESVIFFETKQNAVNYIHNITNNSKAEYAKDILEAGTSIRTNFDTEFVSKEKVGTDYDTITNRLVNLSSNKTVSTVGYAEGNISAEAPAVKICTNSVALATLLKTNLSNSTQKGNVDDIEVSEPGKEVQYYAAYLLLPGEYLLFADPNITAMGILNEGTTIMLPRSRGQIITDEKWQAISSSAILSIIDNGSSDSFSYWADIGDSTSALKLKYRINSITTLPPKGEITVKKTDGSPAPIVGTSTSSNVLFKFDSDSTITCTDGTNNIELAKLLSGDSYYGLLEFTLNISSSISQSIEGSQSIELYYDVYTKDDSLTGSDSCYTIDNNGNFVSTIASAAINGKYTKTSSNEKLTSSDTETINVQSSVPIMTTGMPVVVNDTSTINPVQLRIFSVDESTTVYTFVNTWIGWEKEKAFKVPGELGQYAVIPIGGIELTPQVQYILVASGTTLYKDGSTVPSDPKTFAVDARTTQLSYPRVVDANAFAYVRTSANSSYAYTEISTIVGAANGIVLGKDQLGSDNYNPTYIVNNNDLITDPLDPESFFRSNHPLNRYVLPKLAKNGLSDLKISPQYIVN